MRAVLDKQEFLPILAKVGEGCREIEDLFNYWEDLIDEIRDAYRDVICEKKGVGICAGSRE
eukprot:12931121-Prorocentrum_lima.AAC.1